MSRAEVEHLFRVWLRARRIAAIRQERIRHKIRVMGRAGIVRVAR